MARDPGQLPKGRQLGPYQIVSLLATGGMGEVYQAHDTKLGRDVAIKVLPQDFAESPERLARFQREARTLAALNHPNIATIHGLEQSDGVHYLVMELVEGRSLDRLIPEGGLPLDQILEISSSLAEALAATHEKGIIHRDLKPANVLVNDDGRVKVLDFGIAKEMYDAESDGTTLTSAGYTKAGEIIGTPAYMAPEQIAGRAIDHRTDIFSLGIMLYEMATGQRPFQGQSSAELASAILRDAPRPLEELRPGLPVGLWRVTQRCLEKSAADRFPSARDLRTALQSVTAPMEAASAAARAEEGFWVAVLPFGYGGVNAEVKALAEGLTEDILTGLSRFSYLRVIARSSTLRYAHEAVDVRAVGKELGARYMLEGSLRQAGSTLRSSLTRAPVPISGPRLMIAPFAQKKSSCCRMTSFRGSSRLSPTHTASCRTS